MKKLFTPQEISSNRGCYTREQVQTLSFISQPEITVETILDSEIPLKDKFWFIRNNCDLTILQKKWLGIGCAEIVLEICEAKYPDNKAPREAIQAAKDYLNNIISIEDLLIKRNAAAAAAAYAAAAAASYAAAAASYAAAVAASYAASYANKSTEKDKFKIALLVFLKEFIKTNE